VALKFETEMTDTVC